jgi:hypothetical protein
VVDPVAGKDPDGPVIHLDGEMDNELALRLTQDRPEPLIQAHVVGGTVELGEGDFPGADSLVTTGHRCQSFRH